MGESIFVFFRKKVFPYERKAENKIRKKINIRFKKTNNPIIVVQSSFLLFGRNFLQCKWKEKRYHFLTYTLFPCFFLFMLFDNEITSYGKSDTKKEKKQYLSSDVSRKRKVWIRVECFPYKLKMYAYEQRKDLAGILVVYLTHIS